MKRMLPLLAAFPLTACATIPPPAPRVATVQVGQPARLGPLDVRVDRIVEDSRCPAQVQCVWQGRLVVSVMASDPAALARQGEPNAPTTAVGHEANITLGEPARPMLGHQIALIAATPEPDGHGPIPAGAYRLTLKLD